MLTIFNDCDSMYLQNSNNCNITQIFSKEKSFVYTVKECSYYDITRTENRITGYIIIHSEKYPFWVNRYLHSLNSSTTAKQYAYKLCTYLNYLEEVLNINYHDATNTDLDKFFMFLASKERDTNLYNFAGAARSGNTVKSYFYCIKGLYEFIINKNGHTKTTSKLVECSPNKDSLLYSQNISYKKAKLTIDNAYKKGKPQVQYIKWYTSDEIKAISDSLKTLRDKAIFALTLEGCRIDEALSLKLTSIDMRTGIVTTERSKGRQTGNTGRSFKISDSTLAIYRNYLDNERSEVEMKILKKGEVPTNIAFINLRQGKTFGQPLSYRNFLSILKTAAEKAGLDSKLIRTHSGRSTAAMEAFKAQLDDPTLTDEQIKEHFGWANINSAAPYKNHADTDMLVSIHNKIHKKKG